MKGETSGPIGVGIVGLGRSGWDLHAAALASLGGTFKVLTAFDSWPQRLQEAAGRFDFAPPESLEQMLAHPGLELVVLAVPSHLHEPLALQALQAGKHVVVEKPFATGLESAERMIAAAAKSGTILTCSQNLRFFPDFLKVREVVASGLLGRVLQVRISWHRFRRRWDWQTLRELGGGNLNNDGSHLVDQALQFLGEGEPQVFACMERSELSFGDAENHVKILLRSEGAPLMDLEMTDNCALAQQRWLVMGSLGGLGGDVSRLEWKYLDPAQLPPRVVSREPTHDRSFNSEPYSWKTGSFEFSGDPYPVSFRSFYEDLGTAIRAGARPAISTDSLRRQMRVLEQCRRQGGYL